MSEPADFEAREEAFDAAVAWARARGVTMVLPGGEGGVPWADRLAEALGVPGNGTALSRARRDKAAMAERLTAYGVATPRSREVGDLESALEFWRSTGAGAVVVKPLRSSGGEGVRMCADAPDIAAALDAVLGTTDLYGHHNGSALIQTFARGRLLEVCTVSVGGVHDVVMVVETTKTDAAYDAMRLVHRDDAAELEPVLAFARSALDALGIRFGAAHVEVMWDGIRPVCIEVGARLIGVVRPEMCRAAVGRDLIGRLLDAAADPAGFVPRENGWAAQTHARVVGLRSAVEGTIDGDVAAVRDRLAALPTAAHLRVTLQPGGRLERTLDLGTTPGLVDLIGERDAVDADHAAIRAMEAGGLWRRLLARPLSGPITFP